MNETDAVKNSCSGEVTDPGHLTDCAICAAREPVLSAALKSGRSAHARSVDSKGETFWKRQNGAILQKIQREKSSPVRARRYAAAAALTALLSGLISYVAGQRAATTITPIAVPVTTSAAAEPSWPTSLVTELEKPADPWQSDELSDFQQVVGWESWIEPEPAPRETSS